MGLLFDLGVSSPQLDDPERGFAYAQDAPLDMRMDRTRDLTAADIVNGYPAAELARVLRDYGEERFARRIADAVVRERARAPITSTQRLSAIVKDAIPAATRRTGGNPAKRTFQALRIEVNDELGTLRRALPAALGVLAVGGRVVVLAYHSLEDRIVKRELVRLSADQTPPGLPMPASAADAAVPPAHQGRRAPGRRRSHRQSACGLRPAPGRGTHQESSMTRGGTWTWPLTRCRGPQALPGREPAAARRPAARTRRDRGDPARPRRPEDHGAPRPARRSGRTRPARPVSAPRHTRPVTGPASPGAAGRARARRGRRSSCSWSGCSAAPWSRCS